MDARTIWDWLEIKETRDKTLIRKAYASQAKKYHPEDMPKEAEQLRKAYKAALALAEKYRDTDGSRQDEDRREETENTGDGDRYIEKMEKILLQHSDIVFRYDQESKWEERLVPPDKSEGGYQYGHETSKEEKKVLTEHTNDGYQYEYEVKKEMRKTPLEGTGKSYRYHLDAQRGEYKILQGSGHFDHFQFDGDRTGRLELLEKRLNDIYHNGGQSNFNLWADVIRKCLTAEDLKEAKVVAAVLSILIQMSRLSYPVWDILGQELFRCRGEGTEWVWLQTQFDKMRKEDIGVKNFNSLVKQKRNVNLQVDPITGRLIPKEPVLEEYDRISGILLILIGVLAFILILFLVVLV